MRATSIMNSAFALRFLGLLLGWLIAMSAVAAPDQIVFGPKQLSRGDGEPNLYKKTFNLNSPIVAPFLLRIENGNAEGEKRVTAARVMLNGVQVAGPNDFGQKVARIERTVAVTPRNVLEVLIYGGKSNANLNITILGSLPSPAPITISPDPLKIYAGATGLAKVTISPAPLVAGNLILASSNPAIASVPGSVAFEANQSEVAIPVTGEATGSASITVKLNEHSATGSVLVSTAPPTVSSLQPSLATVTQGGSTTLTLTLSSTQESPVTVALASSAPTIAAVASSITIPPGRSSTDVIVSAISPGSATIAAALNGSSASSQVTVTPAPPTIVSLLPATNTATLGAKVTLILTISAAQATDTVVGLSALPLDLVNLPASVVVPAGEVSVPVAISTLALGTVGVKATLNNSSASAAIHITPPDAAMVSLEPATLALIQDASSPLTLTINAAQLDNTEIALSTDHPEVLRAPQSVTIPAGQTSATFSVTGLAVGQASLTAAVNGTSRTAAIQVIPHLPMPVALLPESLGLQQGATGSLNLSINAAQLQDVSIPLLNASPDIVQLPSQVVIPAGKTSVIIPITGLLPGSATITASLNGGSVMATATVMPPPPTIGEMAPLELSLPKGVPGTIKITINRAPAAATVINLTSSNAAIVEVPATATVAEGALSVEFPVFTLGEGVATISASLNGSVSTSQVTVTAPELVSLTLSPQQHTAYVGETVPYTLEGTYTDGTHLDVANQATWASSDAEVASMSSGAATALKPGTSNISATVGTISTKTSLNVLQPPALTITPVSGSFKVGESLALTVASAEPAGVGGVAVSLAVTGMGNATAPTSITISAGQSSATFNITGISVGDVTVTATAPQHITGTASFTVLPMIAITSLNPSSGPVGSPVTISGVNFSPNAPGNQVHFNGERAIIASATTTELKVIVPVKAKTGPVTVTTDAGTATSSQLYTVQAQHEFDIELTPTSVQAPLGGIAATRVKLKSLGLVTYAHAAQVSVQGLPDGVTAQMERASVYVNGDTSLTLNVASGVASGAYNLIVNATGPTETGSITRSQPLVLEILAAGTTTVSGRVMHAEDDSPFVGAQIRLGTQTVTTDASGFYRFVSPTVLGDQVIKIDGHTAAGNGFEYPSAIAMPIMIESGKSNAALTSYIQKVDASKFQTIVPGEKTDVKMEEIPNYSLNIPQGAILYGWDGTPVTKINVRTVSVDRLPIRPLPEGVNAKTVYLYYFFREGGANPTEPIPVTMVNDQGLLPGEKAILWYYDESTTPDPNSNQWRVMGQGTVSADGKSIVSDPGVGIPKFCCGATANSAAPGREPPGSNGGDGKEKKSCDPVDLASGNNLAFDMRNFGIKGLAPVNIKCSYRSTNARIGAFGRGVTFTYDWFAQAAGNAVRVTTPDGIEYVLSQESDGVYRLGQGRAGALGWEVINTNAGRTLRFKDRSEMDFNGSGLLLEIRDSNRNRIVFQRNANGFIDAITDAGGHAYRFEYTSVTIGRTVYPLVSKVMDALNRSIGFTYDNQTRMTSQIDVAGKVTSYTYDANGLIASKTEPNGANKQFFYDQAGRTTKEILADGSEINYSYVGAGTTVSESRMVDGNGNVTTHRMNGQGYVVRTIDAAGRVTTKRMDNAKNIILAEIDAAGHVSEYGYDARGNRTHVKDALGNTTVTEFDALINKPIKITNALGHATSFEYNAKGNLTKIIDAEGKATTLTYTTNGQLETITDPLGNKSTMSYDTQGNLVQVTDALNRIVTRNRYDNANRLIESVDALGNGVGYSYDVKDRLTNVTDALNGITQYEWDDSDNLVKVLDPNGNSVEQNVFDQRNRLIKRIDAAGLHDANEYDAVGNLTLRTDRNGRTTHYSYDALNRVTQISDAGGRTTGYEYDLSGNVAAIRDSESGLLLYSYDAVNRLTKVVSDLGTVEYQYDALGRRTQRTVNGSDPVTYQYDKTNRLTRIGFRGKTTTYLYDAAGRLIEQTLPNGIKRTHSYDATGKLLQIQYLKPQ